MAPPHSAPEGAPRPAPAVDELALVRAAAGGDRGAWDRLVDLHAAALWTSARTAGRGALTAARDCELAWRLVAQRLPAWQEAPVPLGPQLHDALRSARRRARWPEGATPCAAGQAG